MAKLIQTKIVFARESDFQTKLNDILKNLKGKKILDIKFNHDKEDSFYYYEALIIYEEDENGTE